MVSKIQRLRSLLETAVCNGLQDSAIKIIDGDEGMQWSPTFRDCKKVLIDGIEEGHQYSFCVESMEIRVSNGLQYSFSISFLGMSVSNGLQY